MRRYRFTLDALLRVRRLQEAAALGALARTNAAMAAATAVADQAAARYRSEVAGMAREMSGAGALVRTRAAADARARTELDAQRHLAATAVAHRAAREAWSRAAAAVQALERLDEKERAAWAIDVRRAEDAEMDDLVTGRFGRTR